MKILVYNIKWDTDGQKVKLPKSVEITASEDFDPEYDIADVLSDNFDFLIYGANFGTKQNGF
ncbi:MAG: hypothetical protein HY919_03550 [Elusimicrobia bacterium]|nr:hypothetical protein [Elusimicrobiota bacterium]